MRSLVSVSAVAVGLLFATNALAQEAFVECPPGSKKTDQNGFSYCQATVCLNDTNCDPNVCRPVGLCIQIGTLNKPGEPDGGAALMATQICQEDKQCPTKQTCSVANRCVTKAQADKLTSNTPAPASSTSTSTSEKKSCGCSVVGLETSNYGFGALALSALLVRARRRGSRRKSQSASP